MNNRRTAMVLILVVSTFALFALVDKIRQSSKIDNTVMHYDKIGFTMADGKKNK